MGSMAAQQQWKPFSPTHITYPSQSPHHIAPLLALLSLAPPFGVCALTVASVIYKDVLAAYLLVGSVSSAMITSILKGLIREPRPARYDDDGDGDGDEEEYGMPSNHSCFAWFCAAFVVLYLMRGGGLVWASNSATIVSSDGTTNNNGNGWSCPPSSKSQSHNALAIGLWHHLHTTFVAVASLAIASGCSYSRIYLGYHTTKQVIAGSFAGASLGTVWYALFEKSEGVRGALFRLDGRLRDLEAARKVMSIEGSGKGDNREGIEKKKD